MTKAAITHAPRPGDEPAPPPESIEAVEAVLAEWFARPVVLLSSARAGLRLLLELHGMNRHRDHLYLPPFLARCVLNAVTYNAFPVHDGASAGATLLYHQYGFPQRHIPEGLVIEDAAHAFFASGKSGARTWRGPAIFSLPKFFPVAGLCGGVVAVDERQADALRAAAREALPAPAGVREWMRAVYAAWRDGEPPGGTEGAQWLEPVYELLYQFPTADIDDLAGVPATVEGLAAAGRRRAEHVARLRDRFGPQVGNDGFWPPGDVAPYAVPYFGTGDPAKLHEIDTALGANGIEAGVYHVDVRRDMVEADYRQCVLVPCHQQLSATDMDRICTVIDELDRQH